eukprot:149199-Pelagomonas_calceolata.AAC.1
MPPLHAGLYKRLLPPSQWTAELFCLVASLCFGWLVRGGMPGCVPHAWVDRKVESSMWAKA